MSLNPLEIDLILAKIVSYVGPKFVLNLRLVKPFWGRKALTEMAVAGTTSVRITSENLDDFLGSGLFNQNLQLSLDLGATLSRGQFGHFLEFAPALTASGVITSLTFHSRRCDNEYVGEPATDWFRLQQLLTQVSPTLRRLHILDGDANNSAFGWSMPAWAEVWQESELVFPHLEEFVWGFQEYTLLVFHELLQVSVMPKLVRLEIKAPSNEKERPMYAVGLKLSLSNLAAGGAARLTELDLTLDGACSGILRDASFQLPTVRQLTIHILRQAPAAKDGQCGGGNVALIGHFIAQMFPQLILLDLLYEYNAAASTHLDSFRFPFCIGRLPHLDSLSYGIWGQQQLENSGDSLKLLAFGTQLLQDNFPAVRSVSVDTGLQLTFVDHPLQFLTVSRLKVRMGGGSVLDPDSLKPTAVNLHQMYPHVSSLALDFGAFKCVWEPSEAVCTAARLLIMEFGCLEELELLNCLAVHVVHIWEDGAALFASLRRLTLKMAPQGRVAERVTQAPPMRSFLSLSSILTNCPQMQCIEADEELLAAMSGGVALTAMYAEAFDLQRLHPHLKIRLN